jgi:hypothetical protein
MYSSIYETVVRGSNTVFLNIPEDEYFLSYENLNRENVQDLVENYFKFRGRDGAPLVADINVDSITNRIKVTIDVDYETETKIEPASTPNYLSAWREHD